MLCYCICVNVRLGINVLIICALPLECVVVQTARGVTLSLWSLSLWCLMDVSVLGDELTSCGVEVLFRASGCLLSEHFAVGFVVLGVSVVYGTSPNFTFFQRQEAA